MARGADREEQLPSHPACRYMPPILEGNGRTTPVDNAAGYHGVVWTDQAATLRGTQKESSGEGGNGAAIECTSPRSKLLHQHCRYPPTAGTAIIGCPVL